jgi:hypothetical protein
MRGSPLADTGRVLHTPFALSLLRKNMYQKFLRQNLIFR